MTPERAKRFNGPIPVVFEDETTVRAAVSLREQQTWKQVHAAADKYAPAVAGLLARAFASARVKLHGSTMLTETSALEAASKAIDSFGALQDQLAAMLLKTMDASGATVKLRAAAFNEDQPRDDHGQWTSDGSVPSAAKIEDAMYTYTAGGDINRNLREGRPLNIHDQKAMEVLDQIGKPLEKDTELYRIVPNDVAAGWKEGDRLTDKGFTSTTKLHSLIADFAEEVQLLPNEHYTLVISAKKGFPHIDVNKTFKNEHFAYQKEVILPRGTKFEITSIRGRSIYMRASR